MTNKKLTLLNPQKFLEGMMVGIACLPLISLLIGLRVTGRDFVKIYKSLVTNVSAAPSLCELNQNSSVQFTPERIIIPGIQINLPIQSVPLENGTWKVNEGVANYAQGTSLITDQGGNVGIYAHDQDQTFAHSKQLLPGDRIQIFGADNVATYEIVTGQTTTPDDVDVFNPTQNSQLTLVTCAGSLSENRYIVSAKLISIQSTD